MNRPSLVSRSTSADVEYSNPRLPASFTPQDIACLERTAYKLFKATRTNRSDVTWSDSPANVRRWYRLAARRALGFLLAANLIDYRHPPEGYDDDQAMAAMAAIPVSD